jgi:hypothetical protein
MVKTMARASLFILAASVALPQSETVFEVASVKLSSPSGDLLNGVGGCLKPELSAGPCSGRFVARAANLKMLVEYAYHVHGIQIGGGPSWIGGFPDLDTINGSYNRPLPGTVISGDRFDIDAGQETLTPRPTRYV